MIELAKAGEKLGASSFSEIILCLPGDTKKSHFKTLLDMIDADINLVRSHQFIMLDGSESCTPEARKEFGMTTRYRVMPGTTEFYELRGESFCAPEIDEICIANSTMSFDHYLDCRLFNLTVEIFYNDGVFDEILSFLRMKDVKISSFVMRLYERFQNITGPLKEIHDDFLRETQELWETKAELDQFLAQPGIPEKHQNGELGNNEQLTYRALAIFTKMDALHEMTFAAAREILTEIGEWTEGVGDYLNELLDYSLLRKNDMLTLNDTAVKRFHFDFVEMENKMFGDTHTNYYKPEGIEISFIHSNEQNEIIERYKSEYGMDKSGMAKMIGGSNHAHVLYRQIGYS